MSMHELALVEGPEYKATNSDESLHTMDVIVCSLYDNLRTLFPNASECLQLYCQHESRWNDSHAGSMEQQHDVPHRCSVT